MLKPFRLLRPSTIEEASGELSRLGHEATVYAGGVELLLLLRHGIVDAGYLIDIKHLPGLDGIAWDGRQMSIGACVTHDALATVGDHLPLLAEAAEHLGNIRVRTQGTLGGNLCFGDPHADPATALLIYDASVTLAGAGGRREMALAEFMRGTYDVALELGEVLVDVRARPLPAGWGSAFLRFEQFYRPTLNVAVATDGQQARLSAGCIGPVAMRLHELEARLLGLPLKDCLRIIDEAGPYLEERLEPVDDQLGSTEYKLHLAKVLLARALRRAHERRV